MTTILHHLLLAAVLAPPEEVTLVGRATLLADALAALSIAADAESIAKQVVILTEDRSIHPVLSDEASRALFQDDRLRDRPVRVRARRFPGLPYLQVTSFEIQEEGQWRTPEYYCEVCSISVRFPQICPCCQGPMVLRMKPQDH